jgi:multiple sugar transport system permease protein
VTKGEKSLGILLILPVIVVLGFVIAWPVGYNFWLSLNEKDALSPISTFVGLANFAELMAEPEFWQALAVGIVWTVSTVSLQLLVGVGIALVLNQDFWGRGTVRALVFVPYVIPPVVVALVWKWMLNDINGVINYLLLSSGILKSPFSWLGSMDKAIWVVVFIGFWEYFPFVVISVLARLQTIPPELYDAAKVDGASVWRQFRHVTLPQLRIVLFVVIILRAIWMFNKFDLLWLLTGGGPGTSTQTLPLYAYRMTFSIFRVGSGAAVLVMMFVFLSIMAFIYFSVYRLEEEEL